VSGTVSIAGARPPLLITGGAGFIGCNLADRLAGEGENVLIYDSLARPGVAANLEWLRARHPRRVSSVVADLRDAAAVADAVRQSAAVFHLAAQVAVTTSMQDPVTDFQVNLQGTLNVLEALRRKPAPLVFAGTNKVYGGLDGIGLIRTAEGWMPGDPALAQSGVGEQQRLDFCTPYGCSKGAADQYVLDYGRQFAIPAVVLRMSCIYGPRQLGTEDQGWVAHFLRRALAGEPIVLYGDGAQMRDILHVDDAVRAWAGAWRRMHAVAGQPFNLGGGPRNAVSLLDLVRHIESLLGRDVALRFADWRPNDQRWFVADPRRAWQALGLPQPLDWRAGVGALLRHFAAAQDRQRAVPA
jgi:CDP-paratose 2-epimerase